jgi:integrating conjugative element protein (TIGR03761 family)
VHSVRELTNSGPRAALCSSTEAIAFGEARGLLTTESSMADELRMNLGALRSSMHLTLHTHHATRIWHGRAPSEGRPAIIGLSGFVSIMGKMKRGSEQDDPYSDWWMLRIEEKLTDTKERMTLLREQVDQVLRDVNPSVSLGDNLNVQPVRLPIFVPSQHGFIAIYLLADYDELARRLILAHHTALIDRRTMERWLGEGAHLLRSAFSLAQQYRYSGACRDDFAANNALARAAREKYGEIPQDVLEGVRRSRFAPPIVRRSALNAMGGNGTGAEGDLSHDASIADEVGSGEVLTDGDVLAVEHAGTDSPDE